MRSYLAFAARRPCALLDRRSSVLSDDAGPNDPRVPRVQSDCIVSALRRLKNPVEYMVAVDEGHGYRKRTTQTVIDPAQDRALGLKLE